MRNPNVGEMVLCVVDPRQNNGSNEAPAIISNVFTDNLVNLRVLLDGEETLWLTSVTLVAERPSEDEADENKVGSKRVCFWPPRS